MLGLELDRSRELLVGHMGDLDLLDDQLAAGHPDDGVVRLDAGSSDRFRDGGNDRRRILDGPVGNDVRTKRNDAQRAHRVAVAGLVELDNFDGARADVEPEAFRAFTSER